MIHWPSRRLGAVIAAFALLAFAVLAGATSVRAGDIAFSVSVTDTPDPVAWTPTGSTSPNLVAYPIVIANGGPSNATRVQAHLPAPQVCTFIDSDPGPATNITSCQALATPVYATLDSILKSVNGGAQSDITATCTAEGTTGKVCDLGTIRAGTTITITAVYVTPASGAGLTFSPSVTAKDGAVQTSAEHVFTASDPEADGAGEWTTLGRTADQNGTYVKPNNGLTLTTDPNGDPNGAATSGNPHVTDATIAPGANSKGLGALIQELVRTPADLCGGNPCIGQKVNISIGTGGPFTPNLQLFFRLDSSVTGGGDPKKIPLWHNDIVVLLCPDSGPLPLGGCLSQVPKKFSDKDAGYFVTTATNGTWKFGG